MPDFVSVPKFHEFETPESFVSRLAAFNCLNSVKELYSLVGSKSYDVRQGFNSTMSRIIDMAGLNTEVGYRHSISRGYDFALVHGEKMRSIDLCRLQPRFCPACVRHDLDSGDGPVEARPYQRVWWLYRPIERCVEHGCELVIMGKPKAPNSPDDFTSFIRDNVSSIKAAAAAAVTDDVHPFEKYLVNRINGVRHNVPYSIFDEMPLHVMVTFCEAVGCLFVRGHTRGHADVRGHNRGIHRRRGFELLKEGPAKFHAALHNRILRETSSARLSKLSKYGPVWQLLEKQVGDDEWKLPLDLIRQDALATIPFGPGDEVLGQTVTERRLHNLHTAKVEYGIHRKTIGKLLAWYEFNVGEDGKYNGDFIVFERSKFHDVFLQIKDAVTKKVVFERLGINLDTLKSLKANQIIHTIQVEAVFSDDRPRYVATDIDKVLAEIALLPVVANPSKDYRPIDTAYQWAHVSSARVFKEVQSGKVRAVRTVGRPTFDAIFVHAEDAMAATQLEEHGWLPASKVAYRLATSDRTVKRLMALDFLRSEKKVHPRTRQTWTYIDPVSLRTFDERYVSLGTFAKKERTSLVRLSARLKSAGVEPLFRPGPREAQFFERAVLASFSR